MDTRPPGRYLGAPRLGAAAVSTVVGGPVGAAGLGAGLDVDAVQLERDVMVAGARDVFAWLKRPES